MIKELRFFGLSVACLLCAAASGKAATTIPTESSTETSTVYADSEADSSNSSVFTYSPGKFLTASHNGATGAAGSPSDGGPGTCNDGCCDFTPACNMCPCAYGWVEGLVFWRTNQAANQPLVVNTSSPPTQTFLSVGDLRFNGGGGVRAGFGIRDCSGMAWEFNYFGIFQQVASASVSGGPFNLPGALGQNVNAFNFANQVNVQYTSQFQNFEVNRVCCCCCCECPTRCRSIEWLYGFRYLNLHEAFNITSTNFNAGTAAYRIRTDNNLFGGQLGARFRRCYGGWSWEATGKAGVFGNAAEQNADPIIIPPVGLVARPARSTSGGQVAFIGDLNLTGIYQLNSTWGIRAGYNLIWIEGVALAPNQLDFTFTPTSGTRLDTNGGLLLHGVNLGLEARW